MDTPQYENGSLVYAIAEPTVKLTIRRYIGHIYYCKVVGDENRTERVYFERELARVTPDETADPPENVDQV